MDGKESEILAAVRNDQADRLKEILRSPLLDLSELNEAALTAAEAVKPLYVTLLLSAGANPKVIAPHLRELTIQAADEGSCDALKDLLAIGADPDGSDAQSVTPLYASAVRGHTACAELLLKAGADPNKRGPHLITPLQRAAANGHASVVAALLEGGADHLLEDPMGRGLPLFAAHRNGYVDLAAKIREHALKVRKERADSHLRSFGWDPAIAPLTVPRFILSGTQTRSADEVFALATEPVELEPAVDLPFTRFEGWLKQLDPKKLDAMRCEALDAAFPLFLNLEAPEGDFLPDRRPDAGEDGGASMIRGRRFAGDPYLPRARYFTVCDEQGSDYETLKYELLAYRYVPLSGRFRLVDCAESDAADRLDEFGMKPPAERCLVLVFLPGKNYANPFLFKAGFPQRPVGQILSVHVEHVSIEKTIDLRVPATGDWFARFFSRLVQDISGHSKTEHKTLRSWPCRPPLKSFIEILPALLTQEIGGDCITSAIGAWLRKAGAEALVFPSARNDSYLVLDDGRPTRFGGWNLVDFRGAPPVREQSFLDIDDYWPTDIRLGPGGFLGRVPPNPFRFVSLAYTDRGRYAGSFQIEKMSSTVNTLLEMELDSFESGKPVRPWWTWEKYAEKG